MGEHIHDAWSIEDTFTEEAETTAQDCETDSPTPAVPNGELDTLPSIIVPCRCPACDSSGDEAAGSFALCGKCGTLFLKERPSLGQMVKARDAFFSRVIALPNHEERMRAKALAEEAMKGFFRIRAGKPVAMNAFGKNVLEVNCGLGLRLRRFQDYGWAASGTEVSATAHEYAQGQMLDVQRKWLDEAKFALTRFDLAMFCGSFGEVSMAADAVEKLRAFMTDDGVLCILREPIATDQAATSDVSRLALYTADALRKLICKARFSFESESVEDALGTFWFKAKSRR